MFLYLYIALGSAIGGVIRFWLSNVITSTFSFNILVINLLGSFIIGIMSGLSENHSNIDLNIQRFITIGLCGGFTTFSSFSLDNFKLLQHAQYYRLSLNIMLSVLLSLIAVAIAYKIVKNW